MLPIGLVIVADKLKNLVPALGKRGPHRVLTGDLSFAGIPGRIYVPAEGKGIPGLAFGHDWRVGVDGYHATLRHLASWGIAVAAPDTEKGFVPNHRGFAADLETALQILAGVRLGNGNVTVQPNNLFLAGHGMGAAAAVLAATGRTARENSKHPSDAAPLSGVIAIYPSDASPSPYEAAKHVDSPGMVLAAGSLSSIPSGNPERLAAYWKGDVVYRRLDKASSAGFHEKLARKMLIGQGTPEFANQETARALMTGFVLAEDDKKYKSFREPTEPLKHTKATSQMQLYRELPENADTVDSLRKLIK
ncbi:alpha/beta hydrolase [Corynebacterium anserum]|uniref:Alpha/beta hydrolase n=1 Tax=Corynebacterium anserum TaxID=2684406 RepID=A0A7G7YRA2_9CORY|nr:alpha/beta hydrolase [Corynebacterium anserum]